MNRFIDFVIKTTFHKYNIPKDQIIIFMDNAGSHTSNYMIHKLVQNNIRVFFNVANSPALNAVELVFADLKYNLRRCNKKNMNELLE